MAILDDIGKIERILYIPCAPSPQIWVKAFRKTAITAFFAFFKPVIKSEIKLITGKSWLKHLKQYVEIAGESDVAFFDGSLEVMFEFAEVIDKATWWIFLASFGLDELLDWTTLAYDMAGCTATQFNGTICGIAPFDTLVTPNVWTPGPIWKEATPPTGMTITSDFILPMGSTGTLSGTLTAVGLLDGKPKSLATRVVNMLTGQVLSMSSTSETDATNGAAPIVSTSLGGKAFTDVTYQFQWMRTDTSSQPLIVANDGRITFTTGNGGRYL